MPAKTNAALSLSQLPVAVALWTALLVGSFISPRASGQQQTASVAQTIGVSSRTTSESPAATLNQFCKAVRAMDWESEFLCYTESRRSRFTYFVIRGIDELGGEVDLTEKATALVSEFEIPNEAFTNFPSMRSENASRSTVDFQIELDRRLDEWRSEIYPKVKNWPEFIKRLQPILVENHSRHTNDSTHPSQTGIVSHFNFHYFERAKNLTISEDQAEATTVAIVRDPNWQPMEENKSSDSTASYGTQIGKTFMQLVKGRNIRRAEEKIRLIFEANEWRVESVPFR